jgi:hypothetical protein
VTASVRSSILVRPERYGTTVTAETTLLQNDCFAKSLLLAVVVVVGVRPPAVIFQTLGFWNHARQLATPGARSSIVH